MRRSGNLLPLLVLLLGCQSNPSTEPSVSPPPAAKTAVVREKTSQRVLSADGLAIHYDHQGEGEMALVFVHGWNCDRSYWDSQREFFAGSYQTVTVDLAGHGESDQHRRHWTMQAFGADVAAVVSALGLQKVVLIGHSMGGKVVVEAARQLNSRVVAVVGVDTFHNGGRATPMARQQDIIRGLSEDYSGYLANLVERMFVEQSDPAIKGFVLADMAAAPLTTAIGARRASGSYDASETMASLDLLLILISSDYRPTDLAYLEGKAKTVRYFEMSGLGHFLMLEDPETFNTLLAQALAELT